MVRVDLGRAGRAEHAGRAERAEHAGRAERAEHAGRAERAEHAAVAAGAAPGPETVLDPAAARSAPRSRAGGKAYNLGLLKRAGAPVPDWFVVAAEAFDAVLARPDLAALRRGEDRAALRAAIAAAPLPDPFVGALRAARVALGDGPLAVRSSAVGEDAAGRSFAGQFDSVVNVRDDEALLAALRTCWASAFSDRVATYCARHGVADDALRMAVVVQRMVVGDVSGVLFTRDPALPPDDPRATDALLSAAWGLGEGVVSGRADADAYRVTREGDVHPEPAEKRRMVVAAPGGGTREAEVPPERRAVPCLRSGQARTIMVYGRRLEELLGAPQDVEWTFVGDEPVLLQTRPLSGVGPRTGRRYVWDNSNIIESYAGITAPLTYSFARGAYEVVYRQFCEVMGVPPETIARHSSIFRSMIGYIQGRIYYRLDSWYQVLALLPGFEYNKRFMEQMMGVRERAELGARDAAATALGPLERALRGAPHLVRLVYRNAAALASLGERVRDFHATFDAAWAEHGHADFAALPAERVLDVYRELERRLLWNWKAPIINDFFAMIFFGVLRRLVERHGLDETGTLHNDLLCGEGGMVSTEPARRIVALARQVDTSPALRAAVARHADDRALLAALGWPAGEPVDPALAPLRDGLDAYLEDYGDRCMNELKLESPTLNDDPTFVLAMIRNYVGRPDVTPEGLLAKERAVRAAAEARVRERLKPWQRPHFDWVLERARRHIRDRENLRLVRTRVFGLVRRLFRALGDHLARRGALDDAADVFFLTTDEVFGWVEGTSPTTDLRAAAATRKAEQARFAAGPAPDDRFETFGPVAWGNLYRAPVPRTAPEGDVLRGIGCAPGVVRGRARVIHAPSDDLRLNGEILVAERTDPGWVPLYPSVSGILVERGSALSHSAIVAREFGIPTVVGVVGLTARVTDGMEVELDGAAGTVRLL
jgi:pyruvate,water dikinase